jgi:oligopeptide/dipeptide ABC transporter ATP-binding protein
MTETAKKINGGNSVVSSASNPEPLLRIENLKKYFYVHGKGSLHAVDDVSFDVMPKETLGLVGESGCGKSSIGNLIMHLLDATDGHIYFENKDMVRVSKKELREFTKKCQMVFQDPYSSLNPRKTIRNILSQPFIINRVASGDGLNRLVDELAERVGLERYILEKYPHELDGGKRQMVGLARSLAMNPRFIVCDEPVSALDVSMQATIINLLIDMQREMGLSYLFISHDLSVTRHISNRIAVMYLGQIVELAPTDTIFSNTLHPYSIALLSAVPTVDFEHKMRRIVLTGDVPSPIDPKPGCRFAPRCWMRDESCHTTDQYLEEVEQGHFVACKYWMESHEKAQDVSRKTSVTYV